MKGFSGGRRTHLLLLLALMLLAAACEAGPIDSDPFRDRTVKQVDLSDLLAPEALAVLGPDGLFPKTAPHHSHFDMILEEEAVNLAMAWVRSFGPYNRHQLERQRGGPIDFDRLRPAGRVTVAETPWQALPREIPMPLQKHLGAYFLVTLEEGERAAVTVAVSALATDWQVEGTRLIREGTGEPYGNEFRWVGVTPDGQWGNPRPPEDAALMVARATGARLRRLRSSSERPRTTLLLPVIGVLNPTGWSRCPGPMDRPWLRASFTWIGTGRSSPRSVVMGLPGGSAIPLPGCNRMPIWKQDRICLRT
jgi:hypothetical protein